MNNLKKILKKKVIKTNVEMKVANNSFIQPFKEIPSYSNNVNLNSERINAHDLFSLYTADIIKEDMIYFR